MDHDGPIQVVVRCCSLMHVFFQQQVGLKCLLCTGVSYGSFCNSARSQVLDYDASWPFLTICEKKNNARNVNHFIPFLFIFMFWITVMVCVMCYLYFTLILLHDTCLWSIFIAWFILDQDSRLWSGCLFCRLWPTAKKSITMVEVLTLKIFSTDLQGD